MDAAHFGRAGHTAECLYHPCAIHLKHINDTCINSIFLLLALCIYHLRRHTMCTHGTIHKTHYTYYMHAPHRLSPLWMEKWRNFLFFVLVVPCAFACVSAIVCVCVFVCLVIVIRLPFTASIQNMCIVFFRFCELKRRDKNSAERRRRIDVVYKNWMYSFYLPASRIQPRVHHHHYCPANIQNK